ncbi:SDR family oxidoreductase [Thermaerobacillus caldiproteolyticus]|uniref:SDR family oxidoreductase n=1 Tax=Thermaerobacillus caldiproteolyticus TaxID=247480 RepID=UPI001E2C1C82
MLETELDMGQSLKNHYEKTKYEAEIAVRKVAKQRPTTIIRPGIVVGHSETGETAKFGSLYFMLNFFTVHPVSRKRTGGRKFYTY